MIPTPHVDWFALAPELVMLGASAIALIGAVVVPRPNRRDFGALMALLGFAGAFIYAVVVYVHTPDVQHVIAGSVVRGARRFPSVSSPTRLRCRARCATGTPN